MDKEERIGEEYNINEDSERQDEEVLGKVRDSNSMEKSKASKDEDVEEKGKSEEKERVGTEDPHTSTNADLNTEEKTAREK